MVVLDVGGKDCNWIIVFFLDDIVFVVNFFYLRMFKFFSGILLYKFINVFFFVFIIFFLLEFFCKNIVFCDFR